jgi:thioredoxin 1
MKKLNKHKIATVGLLIAAVVVTVEFQKYMQRRVPACEDGVCTIPADRIAAKVTGPQTVPFTPPAQTNTERPLPQLIDFGAGQCAACKMMDVVLDELARDYAGKLTVRYVDIHEQEAVTKQHAIRMIPTQVFLDAQGNELFRHEGFISKDDILKKWNELGFEFLPTNSASNE